MNTNNISYSKEVGVIKIMAMIINSKKTSEADKHKAWRLINQISNKYIFKSPRVETEVEAKGRVNGSSGSNLSAKDLPPPFSL